MVRHTLKILLRIVHNFYSVSDHFGTLCIKGIKSLADIQGKVLHKHVKPNPNILHFSYPLFVLRKSKADKNFVLLLIS